MDKSIIEIVLVIIIINVITERMCTVILWRFQFQIFRGPFGRHWLVSVVIYVVLTLHPLYVSLPKNVLL